MYYIANIKHLKVLYEKPMVLFVLLIYIGYIRNINLELDSNLNYRCRILILRRFFFVAFTSKQIDLTQLFTEII